MIISNTEETILQQIILNKAKYDEIAFISSLDEKTTRQK